MALVASSLQLPNLEQGTGRFEKLPYDFETGTTRSETPAILIQLGVAGDEWFWGTGSPSFDEISQHVSELSSTGATTRFWIPDLPIEVEERLAYLAGLPPNWDGQDIAQLSPSTINRGRTFLGIAFTAGHPRLPLPFIGAAADGMLVLEWRIDSGKELIVDIPASPEDRVAFLLVEPGDLGEERELDAEIGNTWSIQGIIRRLLAS